MLDFLFIIVGLLLLVPLLFSAKAQRKKILAGALPRAVEIAKFHGWVSPGRLMTQANMTEKDARATLVEACRRGLLFQYEIAAKNGLEKDNSYRTIAFAPNLRIVLCAARENYVCANRQSDQSVSVKHFGKIAAKTSAGRNASEVRTARKAPG